MIESVSRRAFITSSGTYNVRASEQAKERRHKTISAIVLFLDETQHTFHIDKNAKGQVLLDAVFLHLELIEKDYFGLQYCDNGNSSACQNPDVMRWLDPTKPLKKQIRSNHFYFRVKFYVTDPSKLQEEYTRYHFYLQVRKDIMTGRLTAPNSAACLLASYTVQSELGDYNPDEHKTGYLSSLPLIPGQTEDMERKICELHKLHKGQTPADAEYNFLEHAKRLEMYGVDLHKARDSSNKEIQLGVTSVGLVVFQNGIKINTFSWSKIVKISFKRKQFFVQLRREPSENYDTLLGFNMVSYRSCKSLWKCCVEHHTFFRLHSPHLRSKRFPLGLGFGIGSRFSYSGKTEFQTVEEGKHRAKFERNFIRSPSRRIVRTNIPTADEKLKPSSRTTRSHDNKVTSLGSWEPRRAWDRSPPHETGAFDEPPFVSNGRGIYVDADVSRGLSLDNSSLTRSLVYADEDSLPSEKEEEKQVSIMNNKNVLRQSENKTVIYVRQEGVIEKSEFQNHDNIEDGGLVVIKITPDENGRFGFNVKGGADLELPILVSRVAPNTPADRCYPKLSEGDQVVYINGIDIAQMTHDEVVNLIRNARDNLPGELELTVKPNVLYEANEIEEPAYQYVPEAQTVANGADALTQSMLLLEDGLASGAILNQFDQLYRKKPGLSTNEAKKNENQNKNRYRDISPYDETRVILLGGDNGDYINASYVNMEIPGSGIVNRYIATQGPLSSTVGHFWQMVLEAGTGLIVMLTPLVERGRPKCHQYWPNAEEILRVNKLEISCVKEETDDSGSFVFREFLLRDLERNEERDISHMQYIAWPDHGVPDSPTEFLSFTQKVRAARAGMVEPTLVHCSAGIGRTGVLILMETALCLMEANEPVYPLDIVKTMRDQRAMMIQTSSQYKFVCESVLRAYTDGIAEPLPEFRQ
ncbi:UNVERIFIED_CONTAM: hypothetical protein PYX00_010476 [Menopon gallinae]|uniref:Tyrosine-protein phosphatase n=1 Tax=Menopon gallinae TaxID=328185 RepID=A0AAW2HFX8_9NEOP